MTDSDYIQSLINASTGNTLVVPNGTYNIDKPVVVVNKSINVDFSNSTIINQNPSTRKTAQSIFFLSGVIKQVGKCQGKCGTNTLVVSLTDQLSPGDIISTDADYTTSNISIVVNLNNDVLTLDRPLSMDCDDKLYKLNPIRDSVFKNLNIDFNNKYSHGLYLKFGYNVTIENINCKNLGSKAVLVESSANCKVRDINCDYGFDVSGDGGCGYVVRLSVCNDCTVDNIMGSRVRHVVDLSGANRNIVSNCMGTNNFSSDFLTHNNGCRENVFKGNRSFSNQTSGFSLGAKYNDVNNRILGGSVYNSCVLYQSQNNSNIIKDLYIQSQGKYALTCQGATTFEGCYFDCWYTLISGLTSTSVMTFNNCQFSLNKNYSLASNNTGKIIFNNCAFEAQSGKMIRTTASALVQFNNCRFNNCSQAGFF